MFQNESEKLGKKTTYAISMLPPWCEALDRFVGVLSRSYPQIPKTRPNNRRATINVITAANPMKA